MAAGTPPIASNHGAFPELITPGSDGSLFPPTDEGALAEILADVDDHPERWAAFGRRGRETYRSRFTVAASTDRLLEIYRFAVGHPIATGRRTAGPAELRPSSASEVGR